MHAVEFVLKVSYGDTCRTKDGIVHSVLHITVPDTWERGQWRMLETFCGQYLRHHPNKRNRHYGQECITCLGCLANGGS